MGALLGMIPGRAWLVAIGALGVCVVGYFVYSAGVKAARTEALQQSIEILRERKQVNEAVHEFSDADLCRELGGVFSDDGECL